MVPIFMVKRKDGKTDNVYECDFKLGTFNGGAQRYTYDDISEFLGIPAEMVAALGGYKKPKVDTVEKKDEQ